MKFKIQYTDSTDRQMKMDENKDKFLVEEQNITEGNFLIFSDTKTIENQVKELQENQLIVMNAIASLYEEMTNVNKNNI